MCVAFRIGFYGVFADYRLFAHASLNLHLSFSAMRMRLVSSVSFVVLLLKRYQLLCETVLAASCCFAFETSTMQKPSCFEAIQTKTSQLTPKTIKHKTRKHMVFATISKKRNQKTKQKTMETKQPKHQLVDETHTKLKVFKLLTRKPPKNKRHTPRGGGRTRHLVVVVVAAVVVVVAAVCVVLGAVAAADGSVASMSTDSIVNVTILALISPTRHHVLASCPSILLERRTASRRRLFSEASASSLSLCHHVRNHHVEFHNLILCKQMRNICFETVSWSSQTFGPSSSPRLVGLPGCRASSARRPGRLRLFAYVALAGLAALKLSHTVYWSSEPFLYTSHGKRWTTRNVILIIERGKAEEGHQQEAEMPAKVLVLGLLQRATKIHIALNQNFHLSELVVFELHYSKKWVAPQTSG